VGRHRQTAVAVDRLRELEGEERVAGRQRPDAVDRLAPRRPRGAPDDQRPRRVEVERAELDLDRPAGQRATPPLDRLGGRAPPERERDKQPVEVGAGQELQDPQRGLVGRVGVVEGEQQTTRRRRVADDAGQRGGDLLPGRRLTGLVGSCPWAASRNPSSVDRTV
jgi:hypothetical protein